jgi:hypothetical protein
LLCGVFARVLFGIKAMEVCSGTKMMPLAPSFCMAQATAAP